MAFKATNLIPEQAYDRARRQALSAKSYCSAKSSAFAAGATGNDVLGVSATLKQFRDDLNGLKSVTGLAQYAREQETDQTYDVVAEFNAVIAALDAAIATIVSTLPQDVDGYLLVEKINADGSPAYRNFTAGALSTLRSNLDAIVSAVS